MIPLENERQNESVSTNLSVRLSSSVNEIVICDLFLKRCWNVKVLMFFLFPAFSTKNVSELRFLLRVCISTQKATSEDAMKL